jgi:hypothetical protein
MTSPLPGRSDRKVQFGDRGYFCVSDADGPLIQGEVTRDRTEIHTMGDRTITIDKMFGPLAFWPIRVTADIDACEWIIEREHGPQGEWREVCRIPGQLEEDFTDES